MPPRVPSEKLEAKVLLHWKVPTVSKIGPVSEASLTSLTSNMARWPQGQRPGGSTMSGFVIGLIAFHTVSIAVFVYAVLTAAEWDDIAVD
jgi:hypothetical protein